MEKSDWPARKKKKGKAISRAGQIKGQEETELQETRKSPSPNVLLQAEGVAETAFPEVTTVTDEIKVKKAKGKKKNRNVTSRAGQIKGQEVTELQETRKSPSPDALLQVEGVAETAFPEVPTVTDEIKVQPSASSSSSSGEVQPLAQPVDSGIEITKQPLTRSDSELTSIVVVGGKEDIVNDEEKKQDADEQAQDDGDAGMGDISPRRRATLSRLDSAASLLEEVPNDNAEVVAISIQEESNEHQDAVEQHEEAEKVLNSEDIENEIREVPDKNTQGNEEIPKEDEMPHRNPVPDGEVEKMEEDMMNFESPPASQKPSGELMVQTETEEASQEQTDIKEEIPGSLEWEMYKYIKKEEREELDTDFEEYDGQKIGNDFQEREDLPKIDEFMDGLEDNEAGIGAKNQPPSLYDNLQQREMHKYVEELRQAVADEEISAYLSEFEKKVEEEIIEIAAISLEDVQEEERRLREEHIAFRQREARIERDRQKELMMAMEKAKKHVMTLFRRKCKLILMRQEHLMQRDRLLQDRIHRSFRRSENHLLKALTKKMGEVKTMYGDLVFADGQYDGSKCRRWKVDWIRTPQPIQIKLKCLRGVKNKLPASRYVLMASLYSRLGGHVMKWSNLKGQMWGGATLPITHDGEFFNIELQIDQSVFAVCPSRPDMKAGMVLLFELLILRGSVTPTDKVVGWGCFPICDGNFHIADGKHKAPMLRGNMDASIDKFETIEKLMSSDIDHWLCNLYFEIVRLPKYLKGQKEYEVELQFTSQTSKLLNKVDLTEKSEIKKDLTSTASEKALPPSIMASTISLQDAKPPPAYSDIYNSNDDDDEMEAKPGPSGVNLTIDVPAVPQRKNSDRAVSNAPSLAKLRKVSQVSNDLRQRKPTMPSVRVQPSGNEGSARPFTVYGSRKVVEEKGVELNEDESSSGSEYSDDDDVYVFGKGSGLKQIEGQPGMYYKIRQSHQGEHESKFYTMLPKTPLLKQQRKSKKLTHLEELEQHTYSIKTKWSGKDSMLRKGQRRMQYVKRMLPIELDLWQYKSKEFWSMLLMLVIAWWLRMYLHYVGQWILLVAQLIPINSVQYLPYTVNIRFQNTILRTREEIGLIIMGPFTNIMLLVVMILFTFFFQLLYDKFPNLFSRFIIAFGIQTALDPVWILIVDTAKQRYINLGGDNPIGDAYKLFYHFSRYYSNGAVTLFISIAMTIFLYTVTTFCAVVILYMYFMRLHNNGRMLDIYWRLHGIETTFFIPYDLEMSNEELGYICRKAEQWRGQEGEQRKVNVYHYTWEEEEVPEEEWEHDQKRKKKKEPRKETITHISIHTIHLDGLRELHRHFLKLNNGAIVEVFGEVNVPGYEDKSGQMSIRQDSIHEHSSKIGRVNRSYSMSSAGSNVAIEKERRPSQFLDLPSAGMKRLSVS